jgi:hypothetical protein
MVPACSGCWRAAKRNEWIAPLPGERCGSARCCLGAVLEVVQERRHQRCVSMIVDVELRTVVWRCARAAKPSSSRKASR